MTAAVYGMPAMGRRSGAHRAPSSSASSTGAVRTEALVAAAMVVGAAGAAVAGAHASGTVALPDPTALLAELQAHTSSEPAPTVTHAVAPMAAVAAVTPVSPSSLADTVPEMTGSLSKSAALHAHSAKVETAIDRFQSFIGTTRYEGYCERAVENAYGTQGNYGSARADWAARDQHTDFRDAPRGALVFYDTSANAHVAISLGDGQVVSSSAHGQVGIVPIDHFQNPLGWAPAPY